MKYRHEIKYMISKNTGEILKQKLKTIMDIDKNSYNEDNTYQIRSLYFDDPQNTAYYEKLDGVEYRKKYRIRIYNQDDNFIRLECKYKHNNMTSKESVLITKEICSKIINGNIDDIDISKNDILKKFIIDMKTKKLATSVIVDYKRLAYTYPVSEVRITFDSEIKSGVYNYDLFDKSVNYASVIDDDYLVLEVKYNEILPEIIAIILSTVSLNREAYSKFATCRNLK